MTINTLTLKTYLAAEALYEHRFTQAILVGASIYLMIDPIAAAVVGDMKDAVEDLQKDIFGSGWITVGEIAAAAVGAVMSIARSSGMPFAMGAGVAGGLHFFKRHTESAAACLF
jgi:hypothetical protein